MAFGQHHTAHDRSDARLHIHGLPIGFFAVMLALLASMGGFIFGYDTGQISDILIMEDFKVRFAQCGTPGDVNTCNFSNVRSGLIVALLSIGTLIGALIGAPYVTIFSPCFLSSTHPNKNDLQSCGFCRSQVCHVDRVYRLRHWRNHPALHVYEMVSIC